jgi:RNA polymerase primary sigma factor
MNKEKTRVQTQKEKEEIVLELGISQLIDVGRDKSYVTLDDILGIFPDIEDEIGKLDSVFEALHYAGIPYIEDDDKSPEPIQEELENEDEQQDELLKNIQSDDSVGLYFNEISRTPLLSAEEEIDLAKQIERGRMARKELAKGRIHKKRRKQLRSLIKKGWQARDHLLLANTRLVVSIAKRYVNRGVPFLGLIQEGNIGLIRATKKFDYKRGFKFSTYATWWIRQAITRAVSDKGRTIRIPVHMVERISKMLRKQHRLKQQLNRDPSVEELALALEESPRKVENMIKVARHPLSLQRPLGDDKDNSLGDIITDDDIPSPEEEATREILKEQLIKLMEHLPARDVRVLKLRYGLVDRKMYTLGEIGKKIGVTRERVRQINAQALRRLRKLSIQNRLYDYI